MFRRKFKKNRRTYRKYKAKGKKSFAKRVKRILASRTETKQYIDYHTNVNLGASSSSTSKSVLYQPLGEIVRGTESYNRIGSEIELVSITVRLVIFFPTQSSTTAVTSYAGSVKCMVCKFPQYLTQGTKLHTINTQDGLENFEIALFQRVDDSLAGNSVV